MMRVEKPGRSMAKKPGYAVEQKRMREKEMISQMIYLYCRKNHGCSQNRECFQNRNCPQNRDPGRKLCPECRELDAYARQRSDKCPFMETKTFCSNCQVHCYRPDMREKIREVMRFSGPRMILHHPVTAVRHMIESGKEKRRLRQDG